MKQIIKNEELIMNNYPDQEILHSKFSIINSYLPWLLTALGILGAALNVQKDPACFVVWLVANGGFIVLHASRRQWAEALMFCAYVALCVWGMVTWSN
jgi:nicotinamide riboside transporter PnuC